LCVRYPLTLNKIFLHLYSQTVKNQNTSEISFSDALAQKLANKGYPRDEDFEENFIYLPIYSKDEHKTYLILQSLEENYRHKEQILLGRKSKQTKISIEIDHIMPQQLTPKWRKHIGKNYNEVIHKYLHTIGNLTLSGYNKDMRNHDFNKKKRVLSESRIELNKYSRV